MCCTPTSLLVRQPRPRNSHKALISLHLPGYSDVPRMVQLGYPRVCLKMALWLFVLGEKHTQTRSLIFKMELWAVTQEFNGGDFTLHILFNIYLLAPSLRDFLSPSHDMLLTKSKYKLRLSRRPRFPMYACVRSQCMTRIKQRICFVSGACIGTDTLIRRKLDFWCGWRSWCRRIPRTCHLRSCAERLATYRSEIPLRSRQSTACTSPHVCVVGVSPLNDVGIVQFTPPDFQYTSELCGTVSNTSAVRT